MYYTFYLGNDPKETYTLHYDEETRRATNMANGKRTTLKLGIDEYLRLINATVTSKNETY